VLAEPQLRAQAGVIEAADDVITPLAEVGPPVVVGRDDRDGPQDRGSTKASWSGVQAGNKGVSRSNISGNVSSQD
jgi:hypothetical protein